MPHYLDLPSPLNQLLHRMNMPEVSAVVFFKGQSRTRIGSGLPVALTTNYVDVDFEITERLSRPVSLSLSKPTLPDGKGSPIKASEITIEITNTDGYIGTGGLDTIFDPEQIETGEILIELSINGTAQTVDYFRGRIIGNPTENRTTTTFRVRDLMWDSIKTQIQYQLFHPSQQSVVVNGNLVNAGRTVTTTYGQFEAFAGITTWTEEGDLITTLDNSKPDDISLLQLVVSNGADLGKYKIEFLSATGFEVTHPNNSTKRGNINADFNSGTVQILSSYWSVGQDPTGAKITFNLYDTRRGNPVTIARDLIEKSLLENWGEATATNPGYTGLRVDWGAFDNLERRFSAFTVHYSETNKNNGVFDPLGRQRPLNCLTIAQKILDHIGAMIILNPSGIITILSPYLDDNPIYDVTDEAHIISHEITGAETRYNYLIGQYAYNDLDNSYGLTTEQDLRIDSTAQVEPVTLSFPYYKAGVNDPEYARSLALFKRRYLDNQKEISAELTASMSVSAFPGDRYLVTSNVRPRLSANFEVVNIQKSSRGTCRIKAVEVQEAEGVVFVRDGGALCSGRLW